MRASDIIYGKTFHGKILLGEATELLGAALRARDRYQHNGQCPSEKSMSGMVNVTTEINRRCDKNLKSTRPRQIAEKIKNICGEIFTVLSDIDSSVLDENTKGKTCL
jgi:hypothetical protein